MGRNHILERMIIELVTLFRELPSLIKEMAENMYQSLLKINSFDGYPLVDRVKKLINRIKVFIDDVKSDILGFYHVSSSWQRNDLNINNYVCFPLTTANSLMLFISFTLLNLTFNISECYLFIERGWCNHSLLTIRWKRNKGRIWGYRRFMEILGKPNSFFSWHGECDAQVIILCFAWFISWLNIVKQKWLCISNLGIYPLKEQAGFVCL